ncbi:hypothetical protein B0H16DRAFT_1577872 [Mycena metata]|uniref:Uncharacterized protein n=1 Tax=Mycena metata TaxID=1033252 RepID=A0AAD7I3P9_9AGAR|nr:hypothetical protein B0H16DRAFT_1577872 [Mycena metata]
MPVTPLPALSQEEQVTLADLLRDAVIEACSKEKTMGSLTDRLMLLWDTAVRIGVRHGENKGRAAGVKAIATASRLSSAVTTTAIRHEIELEAERIWGFEVGWRLATEKSEAKASPTPSPIPTPSPPSRSLSTAATQTDPPTPSTPCCDTTPLVPSPSPRRLPQNCETKTDAGDDTESCRAVPEIISTPTLPLVPRDLSALSTGSTSAFASLRRRCRRSRPRPSRSQNSQKRHLGENHGDVSHSARASSIPIYQTSATWRAPRFDWDRDPRLRDLGRALTALGWVRPAG